MLEHAAFKIIQLHGDESRSFVEAIDGVRVFKAVPFDPAKIDLWRKPPRNVAALLIDAPAKPGDSPYMCSFPGHSILMRGMLHVK